MIGYCYFMGVNKVNGFGIFLVFCLLGLGFFFLIGCVFIGLIVGKIYCIIVCMVN